MEEVSLADMVAPVPGEVAVGTDVRAGGSGAELYLLIKDERAAARVQEREALAAADPDVDPLTAGLRAWTVAAEAGGRLLAEHAKDLQVAAWITEAWLRTDGLPGLADGFTLLAELVEHYWDEGLFPVEDEDGVETRLAPLLGLFGQTEPGTLVQPIKLLPLTDVPGRHVALWTIEAVRAQAVRHDDPEMREQLGQRKAQRIAELEGAVAGASPAFAADNAASVARARAELDRLMDALDRRTPQGRFGSQVAAPLEAIADLFRQHHRPSGSTAPATTSSSANDAGPIPSPAEAPDASVPKQNMLDRAGALATLLDIAGFFERTEPQSLVGQGIRDLVRRANLPVDDLLAELLPDGEQRAMFLLRAGIRSGGTGSGGGGSSGGDLGGMITTTF